MDKTKNTYGQRQVLSLEVVRAFDAQVGHKAAWAKASRVVSGLLEAAARKNEIGKRTRCGRVSGYSVVYEMTEQQVAEIRAKAIARAAA